MDFTAIKEKLISLGYAVSTFDTAEAASEYLGSQIKGKTVGFAGSMTLEKMELYDTLAKENTVYWHHKVPAGKTSEDMRAMAAEASVYVSSVNGIAESGEIVNIDATCNRVASIFYGHEKVYLVIGKNKIAPDYDTALFRARNIAAPQNAKRLGVNTPCAKAGDRCYNCNSPARICRGLSVLWTKPRTGEYEIVLINEDLGY